MKFWFMAGMEAVAEALASAVAAEGDGTGSDAAAANDDGSHGYVDDGRRKRRRTAGVISFVAGCTVGLFTLELYAVVPDSLCRSSASL